MNNYSYIEKRTIEEAEYMLENDATVRSTAKEFSMGKSTVYYDLAYRLKKINNTLYNLVRMLLDKNAQERAHRGGEATRIKYFNKLD